MSDPHARVSAVAEIVAQKTEAAEKTGQSLGESRVRMDFNPGGNADVFTFKQLTAEFIDRCEERKLALLNAVPVDPLLLTETLRLWSLAQTQAEDAAMWAVKAATANPGRSK